MLVAPVTFFTSHHLHLNHLHYLRDNILYHPFFIRYLGYHLLSIRLSLVFLLQKILLMLPLPSTHQFFFHHPRFKGFVQKNPGDIPTISTYIIDPLHSVQIRILVLHILPFRVSRHIADKFISNIIPSTIPPSTHSQCISNCSRCNHCQLKILGIQCINKTPIQKKLSTISPLILHLINQQSSNFQ